MLVSSGWRNVLVGSLARYQPLLLSLAAFVLLLLPALTGHVRPAIGVDARQQGDWWVIVQVDRQGPASSAGVRVGDIVAAIDGERPTIGRLTDPGLYLESARNLMVIRGGQLLTLHVIRDRVSWATLAEPVGLSIVALVFWALASGVRMLKPDDPLVKRFYFLNLAIAVALAFDGAARVDVLWADIVELAALCLLPALSLSFLSWYVKGTAPSATTRRVIQVLSIAGLVVSAIYILLGFTNSSYFDRAQDALFTLFAVFCLGAIAVLLWMSTHSPSAEMRQQVRLLVVGISAAVLPVTTLAFIPMGLGLTAIVQPGVAAVSTIFLPLCVAYAIFRHGLMDVDVVIGRTLVYGAMTLVLGGCYALFLDAVNLFAPGESYGSVFSLVFFAAVTLTFRPVHDWIRLLIDRLIYRDRYDYAEILRVMGARLASLAPVDELLGGLSEALASAMNLRGVAVLVKQGNGTLVVRGASGDYRDPRLTGALISQAAGIVPTSNGMLVQLAAHGEEGGAIVLGPKRSRAAFTSKDLSLAETIASQASVALANALLVERLELKVNELELLRDQLLHVRDSERKRLAQDLHDGALHTVLALVRQAESAADLLASRGASSAAGLPERLHDLAERGHDAAYELRTICADLYPSELAHLGLAAALESLARGTSRDENLVVEFVVADSSPNRRLPETIEETLYRVARESVNNVCRHASAEHAWIYLTVGDDRVVMRIRDDGRGFLVPSGLTTLLRTGHLGLASMREQVAQLGGELTIVSQPGAGTEVTVQVEFPSEAVAKPPTADATPPMEAA
jgi:signal transduction histidine kinase